MDILNKTSRPLRISLPGGKVLRLGPAKVGQITAKAVAHPAVQKLLEEGVVELVNGDGGAQSSGGDSNDSGPGPSSGFSSGGGIRRTGNR